MDQNSHRRAKAQCEPDANAAQGDNSTNREQQFDVSENTEQAQPLPDAGLDVARWVREKNDNHAVRIVLRTGQPGQAPERAVIRDYDINDYKEKTELTSLKLFTLMHSCLRSHQDIISLAASKRGLEKVIDASATISELQSMEKFKEGVIEQLTSLLGLGANAIY
jgi:hypothetical protein